MAHGNLSHYDGFNDLPTSRIRFGLREGRERAEARGAPDRVIQAFDRALVINLEVHELEGKWRHAREVDDMSRREAAEIDNDLDRAVGELHNQLQGVERVFGDEPKGETATQIRQSLFPEGAGAITRMSFEEELDAVQYVLGQLEHNWKNALDDLEINLVVDRIDTLADQFEDALADPDRPDVTWDDVREARKRGQDAMLHAVATVIAEYGTNEDADIEARQDILGPLVKQNERVTELNKKHRSVSGVDPESGEEQTPEDELDGSGDTDPTGDGEPRNDGGSQTDDPSETDGESDTDGEPDTDDESTGDGNSETDG